MGMRAVEGLDLPGDGVLVLEPAGVHLMLVDARRMEVGETVDVTLVWERAGEMIVTAQVVEPGNTMGHGS
jgi:copper(I)-binding protein